MRRHALRIGLAAIVSIFAPAAQADTFNINSDEDFRQSVATLAGLPGNPFTIRGRGPGDDSLVAGFGITAQVNDRLAVFGSYDGQFSSAQDVHAGELGARFRW